MMYLNVEKHYPFQEVLVKAMKNEEKSKKCNQCDYTTSWAASFEDTFENAQWRKVKQMQPMRLCLL